jgi:hypothetical protein
MSRSWLLSLLCLCAAVVFVQLSLAEGRLSVNEPATKFLIQDQPLVALEVVNPTTANLPVKIRLDLLDPDDAIRGRVTQETLLRPGVNKLSLTLRLTDQRVYEDQRLLWFRFSYRIDPTPAATTSPAPASGVVSLSEIDTPDIFGMQVSASRDAHRGGPQYTHVRALHPISATPVKDVAVNVELKLDSEPAQTLRASALTDANGYALVKLNIPANLSTNEGELKVTARHGGFVKETSDDIEFNDNARIMVTTDKPIYQPGQPLHVRMLIFDSANRAAAKAEATLKITDPENSTVFQTDLVTSRFGVASADWTIPDDTDLGDYTVAVEMDDENYGDSNGYQSVKISRYDLPNFTVSVKPDRTFYLPQQNADVEVRADYLFGQPVKRGHVRVVREEDRRWNYREQKWDITAGDKYEGETDEAGLFKVHLDLQKYHKDLADEDYSRFKDLSYAAYFTDPTSNRTEQRRFDLRVTKDAIHIYVGDGGFRQAHDFPMQFFVATSLADGTPVSCDVGISDVVTDQAGNEAPTAAVKNIRTNKYGIAVVTGLLPRPTTSYSTSLQFTAHSGNNYVGHHTESFYFTEVPVIRVKTDKALYRRGETIKVNVTASEPQMNLFVDISRDANIIESRSLALTNGSATLALPYRPEFRDEVTISVYSRMEDSNRYAFPFGSRTIMFPRDRDLKLNFSLDHVDYKPGQDATVDFRVSTPEGRPASSALGVVIFDRAVEERARTDQDFSGQFGFYGSFSQWRGYDDQIGGITRRDLQRIDLSKPLPEGMDLVAEFLLGSYAERPEFFETKGFTTDHKQVFSDLTTLSFKPAKDILDSQYKTGSVFPANSETLRRLLFEAGLNFAELKDPWGTPYRESFSIEADDSVFDVISAGPDKIFTTKDDFVVSRITRPYFRFTGEAISRAVERFHARTGGFIRDAASLNSELQTEGINMDALRDPWGQPYATDFTTVRDRFNVNVRSSGPNKKFEPTDPKSDDFTLWIASMDYLIETRGRIEQALGEYLKSTQTLPHDDGQLKLALALVEQSRLSDPWGHRYYATYKTISQYADRASLQTFAIYGQAAKTRTEITPVTQQISSVQLRSSGEDGQEGTADDFDVVWFSQLTGEQSTREATPVAPALQIVFSGAKGAIKGTVTDAMGAAIPGAKVKATLKDTSQEFEADADDSGKFLLRNLPAGFYSVRCDASAFKSAVITEVPVSSSNITTLNITLEVGNVSETVTVTAGRENNFAVDTTQSSVATEKEGHPRVSIGMARQLSTPRLREYFPETLVWQPALETDKQGRAQLKFKFADNITTWKMSVIGSTEDGEIGTAEAEIKAFQPFFVDHDPPRVLTEGDRISLPVVLRNYLERPQTVDLEMKPESWFALEGPAHQVANVPAGDAARQVFAIKAVASVKDGKQRVTARGSEASDAIEKPVTVHPDGEEQTQTAADVLGDSAAIDLTLPSSIIPGSTEAQVKIYPSLMAHVAESVEGILERPHGCGEQTISSTYPSLLLLRRDKQLGTTSRDSKKAQRYLELGYQRLLNYRAADGGFTYWGRGDADVALTAYALRFLVDAGAFVEVDEDTIKSARQWLIKQQNVDGSWAAYDYYVHEENQRRTALLTAFVARVLAMTEPSLSIDGTAGAKQDSHKILSPELRRTLTYLEAAIARIDEPYLIASYALAATDAGDEAGAARAIAKLRTLAHSEGDSTYWSLETNTPFYGWGLAGRVETSALVVQALARSSRNQAGQVNPTSDPLVRSGLLFLLKAKDRYGVWYSTQATINVLDTLMTLLSTDRTSNQKSAGTAEIIVNGQPAGSLNLPPGNQTSGPVSADISRFVHNGTNKVELRRPAGSPFASVQTVARYYIPWAASTATEDTAIQRGTTRLLRLATTFDKNTATINEEIVCHVSAERVGFSGYGMLLAEIGLPPGADVDRASLESAMKHSDWAFSQYDILPDRVVVYLWPRAGGVNFDFKFRPRFGLTAKAAPSVVYDYYNPTARAVIAPATFFVK